VGEWGGGLPFGLALAGGEGGFARPAFFDALGGARDEDGFFYPPGDGPASGAAVADELSFRRCARQFNQLRPFRQLAFHERGEILRGAGLRDGAEADQILLHFSRLQAVIRSEEHTSELQSLTKLVCR